MFNKGRVGQCERGWRYVFSRRDVIPPDSPLLQTTAALGGLDGR